MPSENITALEVRISEMKPIETFYNGYRFRSRLEARWAVFFDVGNIEYEYEPEGYVLSDGTYYLPDFYLPKLDAFVEVKRDTEDGRKEVHEKCEKAISWGGPIKQLIILSDVPEGRSVDGGIWHFPGIYWNRLDPRWGWWFFHDSCSAENTVTGNMSGSNYYYPSHYVSIKAVSDYQLKRPNTLYVYETKEQAIKSQECFNVTTFNAYKQARQARFEHGETPTI